MGICRLVGRTAALVLSMAFVALPLHAQQRRYLIEVGAGAAVTTFDDATSLDPGFGGVARLGIWLPYRLSLEGEFGFASAGTAGPDWSVRTFSGALLGNLLVGNSSSFFLKAGLGSTTYDNDLCVGSTTLGPCGSSGALLGGAGFRIGITPTLMLRIDGTATRATSGGVLNLSAGAGISLMLGSKPLIDVDRDGVYDSDDDCDDTPLGALTDTRGCPTDADRDGVSDGLDRCPDTAEGAAVNEAGCARDADGDNVSDGVDACPDTPAGAAVDGRGCPIDTDSDDVPDGLDRCSDTPRGASVDQLGCPGDEDGDRVPDGLDRCPRTQTGSIVNAFGCPPGVAEGTSGTAFSEGTKRVLTAVVFTRGSAALPAAAHASLDSLALALMAQPGVTIEIGAHADGSASENTRLTELRAETVRRYLLSKGLSLARVSARGYGATEPLTGDRTAAGQDRNRRIEMRVLTAPSDS